MAEYHVSDEDPTVMLRWLRASACQGYPLAQVSLGVLYDAGDSVPQDRISAYIWFSEAAQGEGDAVEMAADLNAAMADDERAFAQGLIRQGRSALIDCRLR
jgi:TPR repeat protein